MEDAIKVTDALGSPGIDHPDVWQDDGHLQVVFDDYSDNDHEMSYVRFIDILKAYAKRVVEIQTDNIEEIECVISDLRLATEIMIDAKKKRIDQGRDDV